MEVLGPFSPTFAAGAEVATAALDRSATVVLPYATDLGLGLLLSLHRAGRASWQMTPGTDGLLAVAGVPGAPMVDVDGLALGRRAMARLVALMRGTDQGPLTVRVPVPVSWPRH